MQAPQKPFASQTWVAPHDVPAAFAGPSTQLSTPVAQEETPSRQIEELVVQAADAVQATQAPAPLQTWLLPQLVPAPVFERSRQRAAPVEQSLTPLLQGKVGLAVQGALATQAMHCPFPLQTRLEPQLTPPPMLAESLQLGEAPQTVSPTLQGAPVLVAQTDPDEQLTQAPALQILSTPHEVPVDALASSKHWGTPVAQDSAPTLHGALGLVVHVAPAEHATQLPVGEQTWPVPQVAPAAFALPLSQLGLAQLVVPVRQGSELFVHAPALTQAEQAPATQTWVAPHCRPSAALTPSMHLATPELQLTKPTRQGEPGLVPQLTPSEQVPATQTRAALHEFDAQSAGRAQRFPSRQRPHA